MSLAAELEHKNAVNHAYHSHNSTNSIIIPKPHSTFTTPNGFKTKQQIEFQTQLPVKIGKANKRIFASAVENVWHPSQTDSLPDQEETQAPMRARTSFSSQARIQTQQHRRHAQASSYEHLPEHNFLQQE